jgi:hypothetical protein
MPTLKRAAGRACGDGVGTRGNEDQTRKTYILDGRPVPG